MGKVSLGRLKKAKLNAKLEMLEYKADLLERRKDFLEDLAFKSFSPQWGFTSRESALPAIFYARLWLWTGA